MAGYFFPDLLPDTISPHLAAMKVKDPAEHGGDMKRAKPDRDGRRLGEEFQAALVPLEPGPIFSTIP